MNNPGFSEFIQTNYSNVFFVCEGQNEEAVLRWIIDEDRLCLPEEICDFDYLRKARTRNSKKELIKNCMEYGYNGRIAIIYLLDSCSEKWNLDKFESQRIDIIRILTPPEIEILLAIMNPQIEHGWNKYQKDTGDHAHPSIFCEGYFKNLLKMRHIKNVKAKGAMETILGDIDELERVARMFKSRGGLKGQKNAWYLADLFKSKE